jgi:hypothetical protein
VNTFFCRNVLVGIGRDDEGRPGYKITSRSADLRVSYPLPPNHLSPYFFFLLPNSVMTHENSPLLPQNKNTHPVEYGLPMKTYDRFTPGRKRIILALVSLSGMIPCTLSIPGVRTYWSWLTDPFRREPWIVFVIGSFVPCIPQISRDLRTTGTVAKQVIHSFCSAWP